MRKPTLRYVGILPCFSKGDNTSDFLFASLDVEAFLKWGHPLKERICSYRSKFFPLRVDPHWKSGKNANGRAAPLESVPIHLNAYWKGKNENGRVASLESVPIHLEVLAIMLVQKRESKC